MKELSSIIDALSINFFKVCLREVKKPVHLNGTIEQLDILIRVDKGNLYAGKSYKKLPAGSLYLFPAGSHIFVKHGKAGRYTVFSNEGFKSAEEREKYVVPVLPNEIRKKKDVFTILGFNLFIFQTISFLSLLDISYLFIENDKEINFLIDQLIKEETGKKPGYKRSLQAITEQIGVLIIRKAVSDPVNSSKFEKLNNLFDRRLMDIILYIKNNLDKKLTNKCIADIAFVSEDYIGQLFKSMTRRNLQDFIEDERLEKAHQLLSVSADSIQEIAHKVGFKDPAYFSRRFKMKFGKNANTLRKEDRYMI
jgi:AraC-like DNA-binding protein